ncbi:MAG: hypothetical protein M0R17_01285 [Candidatus Omnitrophica bacterium]|jgi:hypothetical protein|nr:hypothetical protein [Candidatus Omnitrophota bacterium]
MSKKCYAIKFLTNDGNGPYYEYDLSGNWNVTDSDRTVCCCRYGLHACLITSLSYYYRDTSRRSKNRAFIVELGGRIDIDIDSPNDQTAKIAAEKMRFIGEIPLVYLRFKGISDFINKIKIYFIAKTYGVLNVKQAKKLPTLIEVEE